MAREAGNKEILQSSTTGVPTQKSESGSDLQVSGRADGYFYLLPNDLFTSVVSTLGMKRFNATSRERELTLSDEVASSSHCIGRWRDSWIRYEFLITNPKHNERAENFSDRHSAEFFCPFHLRYLYSIRQQLNAFQGYLGWLLTNPLFIQEHDQLIQNHLVVAKRWGIHRERLDARAPITQALFGSTANYPESDLAWVDFQSAKEAFYFRWRLGGWAGPDLPVPIAARVDQQIPISYFFHGLEQTGLYLLPDILPIPGRNQCRNSIDEARRNAIIPDHLADWLRIIRSDNQGKNEIGRFARIFVLQHYWRVLQSRHEKAIHRATTQLEVAFANWFGVSAETIHRDRQIIAKRLGQKWAIRKHLSLDAT